MSRLGLPPLRASSPRRHDSADDDSDYALQDHPFAPVRGLFPNIDACAVAADTLTSLCRRFRVCGHKRAAMCTRAIDCTLLTLRRKRDRVTTLTRSDSTVDTGGGGSGVESRGGGHDTRDAAVAVPLQLDGPASQWRLVDDRDPTTVLCAVDAFLWALVSLGFSLAAVATEVRHLWGLEGS